MADHTATQRAAEDVSRVAQDSMDGMRSGFRDASEPAEGYLKAWERMPNAAYAWAAIGSTALSALFMLSGRERLALFIGQWPATLLLIALFNRFLEPSKDHEAVRGGA